MPDARAAAPELTVAVAENGAASHVWRQECSGATDVLVIAQLDGEPPVDFARRAIHRLARRDGARPLRKAVLALGDGADQELLLARSMLARALLASMRDRADGVLVLTGSGAEDRRRRDLVHLADALTEALCGTQRTLRVRFDAPEEQAAPSSQTRMRIPPRCGRAVRAAAGSAR